jgi:hypothetical protein
VNQWAAAVALLRLLTLNTLSLQAVALVMAAVTVTIIQPRLDMRVITLAAVVVLVDIARQQVWRLRRDLRLPSQSVQALLQEVNNNLD